MIVLRWHARLAFALAIAAIAAGTVAAAHSRAGFVQFGKLLVSFDAKLKPTTLPRHELAPVRVGFEGTFENLDASDTPALRSMVVRLARGGRIESKGLPACSTARLEGLTSAAALELCGDAKVGDGSVSTAFRFPDGQRARSTARLLLFNTGGGLVMHVHTVRPLEGVFLVPMSVGKSRGAFGTVLRARFPRIAAGYGYLTGFRMTIQRKFSHRGQRRSYLVASCPVPPGFGRAEFELARVNYRFHGGIAIQASSFGACEART